MDGRLVRALASPVNSNRITIHLTVCMQSDRTAENKNRIKLKQIINKFINFQGT